MKTGVYIPGLGQSFQSKTVVQYAGLLKNEMSFRKTGVVYDLKIEKIIYTGKRESNVVSIWERDERNPENDKIVYKLYEFNYSDLLTKRFSSYNILFKNFSLLMLIFKRLPLLIARMFNWRNYSRPYQTFYVFFMLLIVALGIFFAVPAMIDMIAEVSEKVFSAKPTHLSSIGSQMLLTVITTWLIFFPTSKTIATELSGEFLCMNNYLEFGAQSQEIMGNLEILVEYIAEHESNTKIHFHAYSCGAALAIDYLFPFGNRPSINSQNLSEVLITIGCPYEFINAYYPLYYKQRNNKIENQVTWINVYSVSDALGTNFRKDSKKGDSQFGIPNFEKRPINVNYEVLPLKRFNFFNALSLYSLHAHGMYWSDTVEGNSCIGLIYDQLNDRDLL